MSKDRICHRGACDNKDAFCVHKDTGKLYCHSCALKINEACNKMLVSPIDPNNLPYEFDLLYDIKILDEFLKEYIRTKNKFEGMTELANDYGISLPVAKEQNADTN